MKGDNLAKTLIVTLVRWFSTLEISLKIESVDIGWERCANWRGGKDNVSVLGHSKGIHSHICIMLWNCFKMDNCQSVVQFFIIRVLWTYKNDIKVDIKW